MTASKGVSAGSAQVVGSQLPPLPVPLPAKVAVQPNKEIKTAPTQREVRPLNMVDDTGFTDFCTHG
jgi:hypothetical protein